MTSNENEIKIKLVEQEDYWKSKIEQIESQHHNDIENLFKQLKLTQESAIHMKTEYEEKVSSLEKQSIEQSKLLNAQSEQLNYLTKGMLDSQNKRSMESHNESQKINKQRLESFTEDTMDSESSQNVKKAAKKKETRDDKLSSSIFKTNQSYSKLLLTKKAEDARKDRFREEIAKESNLSRFMEKKPEKSVIHRKITKGGNKYSSLDESDKTESGTGSESETESDEDSDEETSESSATHTESTNDEAPSEDESQPLKVR